MGSRASSIWGAEPDKYGKWNCRCFDHFCLHIINHFRHKKLVSNFETLTLTKPHIGKKKVIIHTDQGSWSWSKVLVLGWLHQVIFAKTGKYLKRNLDQTRHPGADGEAGDCGGRSLRCQSVPHHVWQPQGSLNRTPLQHNTMTYHYITTKSPIKSKLFLKGGTTSQAEEHEGASRGESLLTSHHLELTT